MLWRSVIGSVFMVGYSLLNSERIDSAAASASVAVAGLIFGRVWSRIVYAILLVVRLYLLGNLRSPLQVSNSRGSVLY